MSRHSLISHFLRILDRIAPLALAERSWDNVGLLVESPVVRFTNSTTKICRVLLTIDLTEQVYQEAIDRHVGIILSYHPPWFRGEKSLTLEPSRGILRMVTLCATAGISLYSPHTALDALPDGINTHVANVLSPPENIALCLPILSSSSSSSSSSMSNSGSDCKEPIAHLIFLF